MMHMDNFVLILAMVATVLAVAAGWLRYDNANKEEETSELGYDTGLVMGVLYLVTIILILFHHSTYRVAESAHGHWQQWRERQQVAQVPQVAQGRRRPTRGATQVARRQRRPTRGATTGPQGRVGDLYTLQTLQ